MTDVKFPVKCEVSIYLTDGTNFAVASGPEVSGDLITREGVITAVAAAVLTMERQSNLKGWRLPTPKEFMGEVLREHFGMRVAVPAQPKTWPGFTQEELDAEVERQRIAAADKTEESDDDFDE